MKRIGTMLALACSMCMFICIVESIQVQAENGTSGDYLNSLNAGVADIIDASARGTEQSQEAIDKLSKMAAKVIVKEEPEGSTLFMANVNSSVNVRTEADENSEKAGFLYKDCGGRILERSDEWTRIQSGDLVGWVHNDYLLFDEEAEALAADVGFKILTVKSDALRVREEADDSSKMLGIVAGGDQLEVVDDSDSKWIKVSYEDLDGYVDAQYVDITFSIDAGETMAAIKKREEEEAEARRKAALHAQQAKVDADGNDLRLLAALIQCEAGVRDYEGQLAVGAVVMNRVRSGAYPNTIYGVIYASGQFTPALNGKVAAVYNGKVYDSCIQAAQAAINGQTNVGTATHFRRAGNREGILIGGQVFW